MGDKKKDSFIVLKISTNISGFRTSIVIIIYIEFIFKQLLSILWKVWTIKELLRQQAKDHERNWLFETNRVVEQLTTIMIYVLS